MNDSEKKQKDINKIMKKEEEEEQTKQSPDLEDSKIFTNNPKDSKVSDKAMLASSDEYYKTERLRLQLQSDLVHSVNPQKQYKLQESPLTEGIKREYRYAMSGLFLGLCSIIGGIILSLHGAFGSTSWSAKILGSIGLESNLSDAGPGVILFVVGVFMIFITRPRVKL